MRQYSPKDNVLKKSYHTNRFYQVPTQPRFEVQEGSHFDDVVKALGDLCKEAYVSLNQLVVYFDATTNKETLT